MAKTDSEKVDSVSSTTEPTESTRTVLVGDEALTLGRPPAIVYVNLLKLVRRLYKKGIVGLREELGLEEGADVETVLNKVDEIDLFLTIVGLLDVGDLNTLGAVLLQFADVEEGVAFVEHQGGFDLAWGMEAFAINCECADIDRVLSSFRRAQRAIQSFGKSE